MIKLSSAKRYAKTLIEIAQETGQKEKFTNDLNILKEICEKTPDFISFLNNPTYDFSMRKEVLDTILKSYSIHNNLYNLLLLLMETGRIKLLPYVCKYYQELEDFYAGRVRAVAKAVEALEAGELAAIKASLEKAMKKTVVLSAEIDKDIIGGVWIKVGDVVYDGTVKRQIDLIKDNLFKE